MPLTKSASRAAISHNIHEMVAAGHPQRQAVAAALHTADEARKRKRKQPYKSPGAFMRDRKKE